MPTIAVIYATTEGQTRKVAGAIANHFGALGWDVKFLDVADKPSGNIIKDADAAILSGSLHAHHFQSALFHFVKNNAQHLNAKPTGFCAVSLSAVGDPEEKDGAQECVNTFLERTSWRPSMVEHVAGALRFTQYDFFKSWIMKRIAKDHGIKFEKGEDIEFTDWEALDAFCDAFAEKAG